MKRLTVLIFILLVLLSACAAPLNSRPAETVISPVQAATQAPVQPVSQTPAAAETIPTQAPSLPIPATGAEDADAVQAAFVDVEGLNLRIGPGLNHRILGVLPLGLPVEVNGRSVDSEWIAVRLADGREGWLFGAFLSTEVDFAGLPVMEAYGGPLPGQVQPTAEVDLPGRYTLYMTIADNRATVSLGDFPANSQVSLSLAAGAEGPSMTVATGWTDANGAAVIAFDMPRYWADGSSITQTELTLVAISADGSVSRKANIVYYQGE